MGKFTHYLITRFNVKHEGLGPERFDAPVRTAGWESDRIQLFRQYCASTVNGQSNTNFTWLLCCDVHSSQELLTDIRNCIADSIPFEMLLVRDFGDMMKQLQSRCAQALTPFVITTRLDNDDGIAIDYVQTVQENFTPQHNTIINQLGGVHYDHDKGIFTYLRYSLRNSFMSLIEEKATGIQTVLAFKHLTPGDDKTIINLPVQYAFWMTLHGNNAARRINLGWPIRPAVALPSYEIDPGLVRVSWINTMRYTLRWFPRALKRKIAYQLRSRYQRLLHRGKLSNHQVLV